MITPELINYIKDQIFRGQSFETIKTVLLNQGWNEVDISQAISQVGTNLPNPLPSSTAPAPVPQTTSVQSVVYRQTDTELPKPKSKLKKILAIMVVLFLFVASGFSYAMLQGTKDSPKVKANITSFLRYVSDNDLDSAYLLFSSKVKETIPKDDFIRTMNAFKAQYSGFESQEQTGFSIEKNVGQPTMFNYSGVITYDDGDKGNISAILVKDDGEWKIYNIEVSVGINRIEKFQQQNSNSTLGVSISN